MTKYLVECRLKSAAPESSWLFLGYHSELEAQSVVNVGRRNNPETTDYRWRHYSQKE